MKRFYLLILLFFVSIICYSQQAKIDSLTLEFNSAKEDTLKARILGMIGVAAYYENMSLAKKYNDSLIKFSKGRSTKYLIQGYRMKGTFYLLEGNYDSSKVWYERGLKLSKKIKNKEFEANLNSNLGTLFGRLNDNEKSNQYYLDAIAINNERGIYVDNINPLLNLSINSKKSNQIEESIKYLIQALKIADKYKTDQLPNIYNQLATGYLKLDNYDMARESIEKGLKLAQNSNNSYQLAELHNSYGYYYEDGFDDSKKALKHYKSSLIHWERIGNKMDIIMARNNIGLQYLKLGNLSLAKNEFLTSLALAKEIKSDTKLIRSNYHLAEYYAIKGNISKVREHLKIAEDHTKGSQISYRDHFYRLSKYLENIKEYPLAYEMLEKYNVLSDSMLKKNNLEKITELEKKYKTEKTEKELAEQKVATQEQELLTQKANARNWLFAIGLLAVAVGSVLIWRKYKAEAKAKQTISQQKDTIESLQKELHHRTKNNLSIIDAFVGEIKDDLTDDGLINKLTELQNRIASINEVHLQLYKSTDVTNVELKKYIERIANNVASTFDNENIVVEPKIDDGLKLKPDQSSILGLIVNEFLTNSYKYAFEDKGKIQIDIEEESDQYSMILADNGKGLPKDLDIDKVTSYGLRIMKLLSKQLEGTFDLKNNNGLQLNIQFPKD